MFVALSNSTALDDEEVVDATFTRRSANRVITLKTPYCNLFGLPARNVIQSQAFLILQQKGNANCAFWLYLWDAITHIKVFFLRRIPFLLGSKTPSVHE